MAGIYTTVRRAVRDGVWEAVKEYYPDHTKETAPIIFSNINGPDPSNSYVVISVLGIYQQGRTTSSSLTTADFKFTYSSAYEVQYRMLFVGPDSGDLAQTFSHRLASPAVQDALRTNKLGLIRKSGVAYSPVRRDTNWVDYHTVDVTFTYQVVSQEQIEYFESALVNGVVSNEGGVEVYNETFNIP